MDSFVYIGVCVLEVLENHEDREAMQEATGRIWLQSVISVIEGLALHTPTFNGQLDI